MAQYSGIEAIRRWVSIPWIAMILLCLQTTCKGNSQVPAEGYRRDLIIGARVGNTPIRDEGYQGSNLAIKGGFWRGTPGNRDCRFLSSYALKISTDATPEVHFINLFNNRTAWTRGYTAAVWLRRPGRKVSLTGKFRELLILTCMWLLDLIKRHIWLHKPRSLTIHIHSFPFTEQDMINASL